ncbi:MAG: 1-acyl-sn-glycerol-3-phosphate acyltransferase [Crocinitomicaceae bacterium]|nr:1-acyl-sn-glycerol-3-phosphate acyltransferase [Crocinitomicaceae bacterium]
MGKYFENIVAFFNRHLLGYLIVLAGLISFFFFGFTNLNTDENIYSIFPQGEEFKKFNSILKENNLNKQIVFSIDAENKDVFDVSIELDSVAAALESELGDLVVDLKIYHYSQEEAILNHHYAYLPAFLDSSDYSRIEERLNSDSIGTAIQGAYDKLTSVNGFFFRKVIAQDPLGIGWDHLKNLNPQSDSNSMHVDEGILFSGDGTRVLFTGTLNFELGDNIQNEELNLQLEEFKKNMNAGEGNKIGFDYFGTFQIAYENSKQVKADTFVTMMVSLSLILLLLIVYYRSFLTPLYFVLPALFSGFCGLGMVGYINPNISAISIATSAVLMGIVLDYSFHFFTHLRHSGDVLKTVRELSFPMLVGSFTTVAAFAALMFTDSVVLQNFGLIALCTLTSAALFTLLMLPTLLKVTRYKPRPRNDEDGKEKKSSGWMFRIAMYSILGTSIFFIFQSNQFQFDSDLNNLSFHTDELVQKEEFFTGINPKDEKKLHLFVTGPTREIALERNFALFQQLANYRNENGLEELVSIAPYAIPQSAVHSGYKQWNRYWDYHIDSTLHLIGSAAAELDFSSSAFLPFQKWTSSNTPILDDDINLVNELDLTQLIYEGEDGWNIISNVVVKRSELDQLKANLETNEDVYIFDVSEMANALMLTVQNDFNYLLIFSSLLVLISLFVVYGRVELALFAFFPMVISWIWILGIAGIFDIQFNFVNIIVATFIFGLGDDFSIFVTDGLLQKYKFNSDSLKSYKSAIILSGITTILGTGALYFAKHPAIHSIAIISVVGIGCILLVTLVIQPSLFRYFVTNRTKKKKTPMTFLGLLMSVFLFTYFVVGCLLLNVFLLLLIPFPAPKKKKRQLLNFLVSKLAGSTINLGLHIKKDLINPENLDFSKPSIIVANHSSFLDILLMIMMNPKVIIMVKKWVYNSPFFGLFIRYSGYLFVAEGTEYNLELIQKRIDDGYSVMIFPEGTRSVDGKIKRFHKGAFYLAQELKLDIQPILIVGAHYVNPKNDLIIKSGSLILVALERITPDDAIYQQRFGLLAKDVQNLMREEMVKAKSTIEDAKYLKNRVQYNYLYKGPIIEWYVRIKWGFEEKNFAFYDEQIGDRTKVYDFGCGLGYLSYFLHYRNPDREIIGIDYDEEKIGVAQNGYDKSENLQFDTGDIREVVIEKADVVIYNDVLHYITKEQQMKVLNNTVNNLNPGGILIIRDGVTDLSERHDLTERTEKYSTKIVNFNKTSEQLSFFSSEDIFKFAEERKLGCEMVEQSSKTSNVLFLLRKTGNDRNE